MTQDVVLNNWERQQYQHFDYQPKLARSWHAYPASVYFSGLLVL